MTDRVRMPNLARSPLNRGVPQRVDASKRWNRLRARRSVTTDPGGGSTYGQVPGNR